MKRTSYLAGLVMVALLAAMFTGNAFSQDEDRPRRGGRGGDFDPEQFRQRQAERMMQMLGVNEEEWGVMEPIVQKINAARADAGGGGFGRAFFGGRGGGRRGGGGGGGFGRGPRGDREPSEAQTKARELGELLRDDGASAEDIKTKLVELRTARLKAQKQLEAARGELREIVTQRQEAYFVLLGTLN